MKRMLLFVAVSLITLSNVFACDFLFKSEDLCMEVKWEVLPPARSNGTLVLTFTDAKDPSRLVTPKSTPQVVLWMSSMGHGSKPTTLNYVDVGQFRSTDVFFVMGGPWDVKYQLKDGNKVVEELVQKIKI